jgi:cation diffusion facilitator family transporter
VASEDRRTVVTAIVANLGIAVAKAVGGAISGSTAMLAEAAHSVADTVDQVFLLISLSLGDRPASEAHPFGYGKERFFWAFLAAVFIFVSGAVFSIYQGVHQLVSSEVGREAGFVLAYVILFVALVAETVSWMQALRHIRRQAAGASLIGFVRRSKDPTVKTVLSEDTAAIAGLLVAFLGVGLHQLTGQARWEGYASILIGAILAVVAFVLGRDTKALLLGEAALPEERETMRRVFARHPEIEGVHELLTMAIGPESLLVAARVDVADGLTGAQIERLARRIDAELREAVPAVREVFLDPTSHGEHEGEPAD